MKCHDGLSGFLTGLLLLCASANTGSAVGLFSCPVYLAWDSSTDARVTGYALYFGLTNAAVTNRLDVGGVHSVTLTNLYAGSNYFFSLVTYDAAGSESAPATVGPFSPPALTRLRATKLADGSMSLRFRSAPGSICRVEYAPAFPAPQWWRTLVTTNADANGNVVILDPPKDSSPTRFYRVARPVPVPKEEPKRNPVLSPEL